MIPEVANSKPSRDRGRSWRDDAMPVTSTKLAITKFQPGGAGIQRSERSSRRLATSVACNSTPGMPCEPEKTEEWRS